MARKRYAAGANSSQQSTLSGKLLAILILVMVFAVAIAAFRLVKQQQAITITGKTAEVTQLSDDQFKLSFDVTRDDTSTDSYCIVKALNYDMAEVGRREVVIPAGGNRTARYETIITTSGPGASADVYGCATELPFYLSAPDSPAR
ncbi:DUF4307 domain-containing protein [Corynebacterium pelargi]|uniref:Uncharacterized protein n=1 Tax=Corynebacterium pelargi TaxID=1471400 RepID=A0A410W9T3_9CORY|nr:DUF4307 domain-containing protein [Corynebacterium pelargi]QAU52712.1 hypothetical protein CPELA_07250 [Corynebacterium pelargi]GGG78316.1 hypothetical protein GCM10007338_15420 [Corynebacterium pelargi]